MELLKVTTVFLMLVPLIGAITLEEEVVQLKEIVHALQERTKFLEDHAFSVKQNDAEELGARVTVLEESMVDVERDVNILQNGFVGLSDDMEDVETANVLQDERLNTLEAEILDNDNDIEELVDTTTGLSGQVFNLEEDVLGLEQRVGDLEGEGGNSNITDLTERVETLEGVTSQLSDATSAQSERISNTEEDVLFLDQRVEDLESGGGAGNLTDYGDTIFLAALQSSISSTADPVLFDWEVINHGGHYNPSTGEYTVPYDGIYQFHAQMQGDTIIDDIWLHIQVDGNEARSHRDGWVFQIYRSATVLLELQAGQAVSVYMYGGARGSFSYLYTYFSGYMISVN